MLTENDVVDAVCGYLRSNGYVIRQRLSTTAKGIDIIAAHPKHPGRLLIEAKGSTSSRAGSARYGFGFDDDQVFDRVAKGFYTGARLYTESRNIGDKVGLAFPDTSLFRKYLDRVKAVMDGLGIVVYLVEDSPQRTVTVF
jgi:hypothetical protein